MLKDIVIKLEERREDDLDTIDRETRQIIQFKEDIKADIIKEVNECNNNVEYYVNLSSGRSRSCRCGTKIPIIKYGKLKLFGTTYRCDGCKRQMKWANLTEADLR